MTRARRPTSGINRPELAMVRHLDRARPTTAALNAARPDQIEMALEPAMEPAMEPERAAAMREIKRVGPEFRPGHRARSKTVTTAALQRWFDAQGVRP